MSSPPNVLDGCVDDGGCARRGRDVGDDAVRPPRARRVAHGRVERLGAARAEDDVRALLDEPRRDPAADPAARAGDERDLAG